ncbi:hypothetical protein SOM61_02985 [Massilia sp. CFBP9012]|uniref:hypothetical protein n=1 Tax=Massilia sp. CFBP9012 TaxID=3096531 RepID=UPI002A6B628D|nr:hypothetical protein [Massilia sp. CFBP9012]MDY0973915.1 hypothetical protein [Massilia sp. CFBP9012]
MKKRILMCSLVAALAPAGMLLATSSTALAQTAPQSRTVTPAIEGFHVEKVPRLEQGAALHFHVYGTRNATVNVTIDGATRSVQMQETDPGRYSGSYVIGNHDRFQPDSPVTAEMRLGSQIATTVLRDGLVSGAGAAASAPSQESVRQLASKDAGVASAAPGAAPPPPPRTTERPRVARYCTSCAVVEKVEIVREATGGARPLASDVQAAQRYRVTVRFDTTEATQAIEYDNNPGYRKGDRVRVNDGVLSLDKE